MRARHRHFNPKNAGATAVFDSRYISGLSDGSAVQTWTSRTGSNNISQATAANRPTYETNEINGNPSVLWDGGANDELTFASAPSYASASIVIVYKNNDAVNGSVVFARNNNFSTYTYYATNFCRFEIGNDGVERSSDRTHNLGNVFLILSATKNGTSSARVHGNGIAGNEITTGIRANFQTTGIGKYLSTSVNTQGHLGLAVLADTAWGDSLRRRLEHAAAFSFKIACN
jgi:hypothetical protein